ncbi:MAG: hypothetical protein IIC07_02260, partial [Proteobacteria bacterium]|nr:hypothetical protein [Pseudomonadota bacterium]
ELKNPRNLDPALYRRIGSQGIIVFGPLSEDDYAKIIDIEIAKLQAQLNETSRANGTASLIISVTDEFKGFLLAQADNPAEGASQIASIINKWMRDPLATRITAGSLRRGDSILFALKDGKLEILRTSVKDGERPPVDFEQEQDDDSDLIIYMNEELKKFEEGMINAMRYLLRGANSSSGPSRHSISEASPHRPASSWSRWRRPSRPSSSSGCPWSFALRTRWEAPGGASGCSSPGERRPMPPIYARAVTIKFGNSMRRGPKGRPVDLHLVDGTEEDVVKNYKIIRAELKSYGARLEEKPEIVLLNKCDALTGKKITIKQKALEKIAKTKVLAISGVTGKGIKEALKETWKILKPAFEKEAELINRDRPDYKEKWTPV